MDQGTRIGVVTFPGSLDDGDAARAVRVAGAEAVPLWHGDADLLAVDAVILPGGFSYGDYLRAGAIARFAPIMGPIIEAARNGLPVLGICNGFQVLCESHLLPGYVLRRRSHRRHARDDPRHQGGCAQGGPGEAPPVSAQRLQRHFQGPQGSAGDDPSP